MADFIHRVGAYPIVSSAVGQATGYYSWAKERHPSIRSAAEATEAGVMRVAGSAQPLLTRFETRLTSLDQLACQQLDRLESRCPVINQPTQDVVSQTQKYYSDSVKPKVELVLSPVTVAVNTVHTATDYSVQQYHRLVGSRYCQAGLHRLDELLEAVERYLEHRLPDESDESEKENAKESAATEEKNDGALPSASARRAIRLGSRLRRSLRVCVARPVEELRSEFWARVEANQAIEGNDADQANQADEAKEAKDAKEQAESKEISLELARQCLLTAQALSVAGWQVTASRVQQLRLAQTLREAAVAIAHAAGRVNLTEFFLSAFNKSPAVDEDQQQEEEQQQPAASSLCYDDPEDLETTDETDSDPSLNETN